jgi:T5SS/PEP-CTERM-associated repeat protein
MPRLNKKRESGDRSDRKIIDISKAESNFHINLSFETSYYSGELTMFAAAHHSRSTPSLSLAALAVAALVGLGAQANAATATYWKAAGTPTPTLDGDFNDATHWNPTAPTSTTDNLQATFNVAGAYTVSFAGPAYSQTLYPLRGNIKFDLNSKTYAQGSTASDYTFLAPAAGNSVSLDISNGTLASQRSDVGYNSNATAAVTLSSSTSHWTNAATIEMGDSGVGTVYLKGGATGSSTAVTLGLYASGNGTLTVDGTGGNSTWAASGNVSVGPAGTGTINIIHGGKMTGSKLWLAWNGTTSVGNLFVSGSNSSYTAASIAYIGGYSTYPQGASATVDVEDSGTLQAAGVTIYPHGHIILKGGTIKAGSTGTGTVDATGGGTFDIFKLSNAVNGNLTLGSTTDTTIHLTSDADYGNLKVTKTLTAAGMLHVVLDGAYAPSNGDTYDLFDGATGTNPTFSGTFSNTNTAAFLPTLAAGLSWDYSKLYTTGIIAVVPEPASLSLLAAVGLLALRRRRHG